MYIYYNIVARIGYSVFIALINYLSKLHTEKVPAQHNTRHKANGRQTDGR